MGRKKPKEKSVGKVTRQPHDGHYGTHKAMIIWSKGDIVIAKDELGTYMTSITMVDNGLMDQHRHSSRIKVLDVDGLKKSLGEIITDKK